MFSPAGAVMPTPMVFSCFGSLFGAWTSAYAEGATAAASQTGIAANQAIYVPVVLTTGATWTRGWWWNGSVPGNAGNIAVGIYDEAGNRLATTGAVAASGASVVQSAAFSASVFLYPGAYYVGYSPSASGVNATWGFSSSSSVQRGRYAGAYTQAVGSHPLPATATFATWSSQVVPMFGIARTSFAI